MFCDKNANYFTKKINLKRKKPNQSLFLPILRIRRKLPKEDFENPLKTRFTDNKKILLASTQNFALEGQLTEFHEHFVAKGEKIYDKIVTLTGQMYIQSKILLFFIL